MEKKLLPAWEPARLVKAADRWFISFYATTADGRRRRYKPTFNLNRIHNLREREKRAARLVQLLNTWMDAGRDPDIFDEIKAMQIGQVVDMSLATTPAADALIYSRDVKVTGARPDSVKTYRSICNLFIQFLEAKGWGKIEIGAVSRAHAAAYLDHCRIERGVSNTTFNNNLTILHGMFEVLVDRGYTDHNPFSGIKTRKGEKKKRRNFTPDEAKVVIERIQQEHELLFLGLLLQYCCFLRPAELLRLRFRNVELDEGIIILDGDQAKTHTERIITIPDEFISYFPAKFLSKYPRYYLIFGKDLAPHPEKAAGKGSMYRRHQRILKKLKKEKLLGDIAGLTWYSWKDTGITDALEDLPILYVQDQAGHSSPKMTLKYRHKNKVNEKIKKGFRNRIL